MASTDIEARERQPSLDTRSALLNAGERLIAQKGIEGTNLIAVARDAGQANKYAVQYHFGDKKGLISAILEDRVVWLEEKRFEYFEKMGNEITLRALLNTIMGPVAELVDDQGYRTYARFLLQFMIQFEPWKGIQHPLRHSDKASPTMKMVRTEILDAVPHLPKKILYRRLDWCFRSFLGMLVDYDNRLMEGKSVDKIELQTDELLTISVAVIRAIP